MYGYVRIIALGVVRTVKAFDSALGALRTAPGLLLDLRNMPGCDRTDVAQPILESVITDVEAYQRVILRRGAAYTRTVAPRRPWACKAPVVVLVSRWTGSMGEGMGSRSTECAAVLVDCAAQEHGQHAIPQREVSELAARNR